MFRGDQKEDALNIVRELKARYGEPRIDFVESKQADVLHFRFKDTALIGRVIFSRYDTEQRIHCPHCGNAMKRKEDNTSLCHHWSGVWSFNRQEAMWVILTLTQEVPSRENTSNVQNTGL